jgi:hypothetical protein
MLIEMQDWDGNKTRVVINNLIIGTEAFRLIPTLYPKISFMYSQK